METKLAGRGGLKNATPGHSKSKEANYLQAIAKSAQKDEEHFYN
jgi:hypothetical protein